MSKRPLQVGDRVRFVGPSVNHDSFALSMVGRVSWFDNEKGKVLVDVLVPQDSSPEKHMIHRRQITHRIKPRAPKETKPERIQGYVSKYPGECNEPCKSAAEAQRKYNIAYQSVVHLIELRPGEVILDYDKLANAMDSLAPSVFDGVGNALMGRFCAKLGIPYPPKGSP